mgnify:CR=1 FL=1
MISDLYPCGFVVQSSEPGYLFTLLGINELRYCGLGRYLTWPLEHVQNDLVADGFWKEASRTWFNYTDERAWSVPDQDYIRRYVNYCESLGIKTRVLSLWSTFDFSMEFERDESKSILLGYDYSGGDLDCSLIYNDLFDTIIDDVTEQFTQARESLNENGLFSNLKDAEQYVTLRIKLQEKYDLEDIYEPQILKLYTVKDFDQSLAESSL